MGWGRLNQRKIRSALFRERGWPNPLPRARLYAAALERLGSYGKVARQYGVTREEVCTCRCCGGFLHARSRPWNG